MRIGVPAMILVMLAAGATPAWAQGDHMAERIRSGQIRPLDRILPAIRRSHPGTFYDAEGPVPGPDGQYRYHLKWMTPDGRIIWLDTDARTGRVLGIEGVRRGQERRDYFQHRFARQHAMEGGPPDLRNQQTAPTPADRFDGDRGWNNGPRGNRQRHRRGH